MLRILSHWDDRVAFFISTMENEATLAAYADTLEPCVYDDFLGTAKAVLTQKHREGLRHLLSFRFRKHSRYNLPDKRLRLIEKEVQKRARALLDLAER
jgi:hypothetical protein